MAPKTIIESKPKPKHVPKTAYRLTLYMDRPKSLNDAKRMDALEDIAEQLSEKYHGNVVGSYSDKKLYEIYIFFNKEENVVNASRYGILEILEKYPSYPKSVSYKIGQVKE